MPWQGAAGCDSWYEAERHCFVSSAGEVREWRVEGGEEGGRERGRSGLRTLWVLIEEFWCLHEERYFHASLSFEGSNTQSPTPVKLHAASKLPDRLEAAHRHLRPGAPRCGDCRTELAHH